jgi:hypothetical protein
VVVRWAEMGVEFRAGSCSGGCRVDVAVSWCLYIPSRTKHRSNIQPNVNGLLGLWWCAGLLESLLNLMPGHRCCQGPSVPNKVF